MGDARRMRSEDRQLSSYRFLFFLILERGSLTGLCLISRWRHITYSWHLVDAYVQTRVSSPSNIEVLHSIDWPLLRSTYFFWSSFAPKPIIKLHHSIFKLRTFKLLPHHLPTSRQSGIGSDRNFYIGSAWFEVPLSLSWSGLRPR